NEKLEAVFPDDAEIVRLKIIAGLTIEQVATVLDVSSDRVVRSWSFAKAWLCRELESGDGEASDESGT
ncbi:MAG: ECF-type sigma factor, partial [Dechloromonas sp.]|nr:ECF-type sigma factor [Dechloromonas sp.]